MTLQRTGYFNAKRKTLRYELVTQICMQAASLHGVQIC